MGQIACSKKWGLEGLGLRGHCSLRIVDERANWVAYAGCLAARFRDAAAGCFASSPRIW